MSKFREILDDLSKEPDDLHIATIVDDLAKYTNQELATILATCYCVIRRMADLDRLDSPQVSHATNMALAMEDAMTGLYCPSERLQLLYMVIINILRKNGGRFVVPFDKSEVGTQFTIEEIGENTIEAKIADPIEDDYKGLVC